MERLRIYSVNLQDELSYGWVVARSIKEAKKFFIKRSSAMEIMSEDPEWFINMRVTWCKNANVKGLELFDSNDNKDDLEGLRRNIYSFLEYSDCPICKRQDQRLSKPYDDKIMCEYCEEQEGQQKCDKVKQ